MRSPAPGRISRRISSTRRPRPLRASGLAELTRDQEQQLLERHLNRVTDTCIPEEEAFRRLEDALVEEWSASGMPGSKDFPHRILCRPREGRLEKHYQIDPKGRGPRRPRRTCRSSSRAGRTRPQRTSSPPTACRETSRARIVRSGVEYMIELADWYEDRRGVVDRFLPDRRRHRGGLPDLRRPDAPPDLGREVPLWGYFCQIGDSTTSYEATRATVPNEKITWGKLGPETPSFMIESDATIVAPWCSGTSWTIEPAPASLVSRGQRGSPP